MTLIAEPAWTNPLREIERAVTSRAKSRGIDPGTPEGSESLRSLLDEEVRAWDDGFRRGSRPLALADPARIAERAWRNLAGFGPLEALLNDSDVWEIMINSPSQIFVRRHTGLSGYHDEAFHDDEHVLRVVTKLLDEASSSHRKLDPAEGLQDAQLTDGSRVHIVHGDIARGGHLLVNIRRHTGVAIRSLDQLVERDMLSRDAAHFLRACVAVPTSIVFAGPPGSGKTTLLSCCAAELDPHLRVVIAEEVFETDIPLANVAHVQTRPARTDRDAVDLRRLVAGFLRMAPDVAIVGEVRDREALPLLLTLSSGVKGFTTIHSGNARQALTRLRFVAQLADTSSDLPVAALTQLVSEAVELVVHSTRIDGIPRITEIVAVEDPVASDGTTFTTTPLFTRASDSAPLVWTGVYPTRLGRLLEQRGVNLASLLARDVDT